MINHDLSRGSRGNYQAILKVLPLVFFLFILAGIGAVTFRKGHGSRNIISSNELRSIPVYGKMPDFVLTERSGRKVQLADLKGKPWVAGFVFTRCQEQCPLISSQLAILQYELTNVQFVSFTVDPDFDTPGVLSKYAERWKADADRWLFLTGERQTLNRVTTGLHMNTIDEPMFHSASLALIDAGGNVRGYYEAGDEGSMDKLRHDVRNLI